MQIIEMMLMTKSSKYGAYCVAGFRIPDGQWVRLVSEDEETHGAVDDDMLYDAAAGRCADVLDCVQVEIDAAVLSSVQTENVLVKGNGRIRILGRATIEEAVRLHPFEERDAIFFSHHYIVEREIGSIHHSLEFVRAVNVHIYTVLGSSGKPKYKVDFECGGRQYSLFAMTDPAYYEKKDVWLDSAALALSISDDEWSRANGHYIYAARIFDLTPRIRRRKRIQLNGKGFLRSALLTGTAALLIMLAAWMAKTDTVYVPNYTGAKYHTVERCELLVNPQAARKVPALVGRIFWKPCSLCAAE